MERFGTANLEQLYRALRATPPEQHTVANAELVVAYLRHGGNTDMCLRCLAELPVLYHRADDVEVACIPPFTVAKLRCMSAYAVGSTEDLVYALRFTPKLAPSIVRLLARIATPDNDMVVEGLAGCLHTRLAAVDAASALLHLCTSTLVVDTHLVQHMPAIAALAVQYGVAVRLMQHMVDRSALAEEAVFDHALPVLVQRGQGCRYSVHLMRSMANKYPRAVVRCGGLLMIMLAGGAVPSAILRLYEATQQPDTDQEVHAFMHCRMQLPEHVEETMCRVLTTKPAAVRALFATAFVLARTPTFKPLAPALPDFDIQHDGTLQLVPSSPGEVITVLLAPVARAVPFIDAYARNDGGSTLQVPLQAKYLPMLVRALYYDDMPDDCEALRILAQLGHMWCAPRLVYRCVDTLALYTDFWQIVDLAADWPEVKELLRFFALDAFVDLAQADRAHELNDFIWTCK